MPPAILEYGETNGRSIWTMNAFSSSVIPCAMVEYLMLLLKKVPAMFCTLYPTSNPVLGFLLDCQMLFSSILCPNPIKLASAIPNCALRKVRASTEPVKLNRSLVITTRSTESVSGMGITIIRASWMYSIVLKKRSLSAILYGLSFVFSRINKLRSEEHTSELQSRENLVCRLLLEKKK